MKLNLTIEQDSDMWVLTYQEWDDSDLQWSDNLLVGRSIEEISDLTYQILESFTDRANLPDLTGLDRLMEDEPGIE